MRKLLLILTAMLMPTAVQAEDILEGMRIEPEFHSPKYYRSDFGKWRDGCPSVWQAVLREESHVPVHYKAGGRCNVDTGKWYDPYAGIFIFTAQDMVIDHLVPLREAHVSGANTWNDGERRAYLNFRGDPWHLIAVDHRSKREKDSQDPGGWLPANEKYHCRYVWNWVQVKKLWNLSVDPEEAKAIRRIWRGCS